MFNMGNSFNSGLTKANLKDAYVHLTNVLQSDSFLNMEGLNGDIPFHICPYDPALQTDINLLIKQLTNYLSDMQVKVLEINLYNLVIELLKEEGDWEWLLENEATLGRDELREELERYHLDVTAGRNGFPRQMFHKIVSFTGRSTRVQMLHWEIFL